MTQRFDVVAVRQEFPVTKRMLYLDSAHQTPLSTRVRAGLNTFYDEAHETAGPKSVWLARVDKIRSHLARFIGASADEIAFVRNTSEGLNIAAQALPLKAGDNVLMISGDHPNNAYAFLNLASRGVETRFVPLTTEVADAATFRPYIDQKTRAISLSHVSFHAGHRHDVESVGKLCEERGLFLIVDAMQSVGVLPVNVRKLGASFLAAGCHKGLLTPQGLGIVYAKRDLEQLSPAYLALASLADPPADLIAKPDKMALAAGARRFEYGNYNLPALHGLDGALGLIEEIGLENVTEHVLDLSERLIAHMDRLDVGIVGPRSRSNLTHIVVLDLQPEWTAYFAGENVRISPERDGVRVSLGIFNTFEDVDKFAEIVQRGLKMLPASKATVKTS